MEKIIVSSAEEIKNVVMEAISEYFKQHPDTRRRDPADNLSMDDAVKFLRNNGFPTSKPRLYKLTAAGKIPFKKYGNKLLFSRKLLLEWAQAQTIDFTESSERLKAVIESARRK